MAASYRSSPMVSNYQIHQDHITDGFHQTQVVVVVVPFPAQGHLNQLLHLSRLILAYNIPVHYVGTATHNHQATARVHGWDPKAISNIHFHDFEVPPYATPPPNPNAKTKFPAHLQPVFEASSHLREPVAALLRSLSSVARRVIVIHDSLMASVVQDVTNIANAEDYIFHSVSAFTVFWYFWEVMGRPLVESTHTSEEIPSLEGCYTTHFMDFVTSQYEFHKSSKGSLYNTSRAIESPYMELIERIICKRKHWALGPFNPIVIHENKNSKRRHFSLEWLDRQEPNSVIYVSFGTTTALSEAEIKHLAVGLEKSQQKFIWVLRDADKGDIFNGETRRSELPKGFEERIEGIGLIVRDWAPQLEILSHSSTGGFMSHCGWNSSLESIIMGVPMAAWPMHSDQPRNGVLITDVLKVGLVVKDWARRDELVTATVVEDAVRRLMVTKEGEEMRKRAMKLRNDVLASLDEGGVSRLEMDSFIAHITR